MILDGTAVEPVTGNMAFSGFASGTSVFQGNLVFELSNADQRAIVYQTDSDFELQWAYHLRPVGHGRSVAQDVEYSPDGLSIFAVVMSETATPTSSNPMADVDLTLNLVKMGAEFGEVQWAVRLNATDEYSELAFDPYDSNKLYFTSRAINYNEFARIARVDLSGANPVQDFLGYYARAGNHWAMKGNDISFSSGAIFFTNMASGINSHYIPSFYRIEKSDMTQIINRQQDAIQSQGDRIISSMRVASDDKVYAAWCSYRGLAYTYYDIA